MRNNIVYFQPPGIKPQYCEKGVFMENDPDHIWFLNEPCKILKSEVKIIPKEEVIYNKRSKNYEVRQYQETDKEFNERFSRAVCKAMDKKKVSQFDLASAIGCTQASISNWISGKNVPRLRIALKICTYLGIDLEVFI